MDFDRQITDPDYGIFECAKRGSKHGAEFYIQKGAHNWKWGMYGAARGGY